MQRGCPGATAVGVSALRCQPAGLPPIDWVAFTRLRRALCFLCEDGVTSKSLACAAVGRHSLQAAFSSRVTPLLQKPPPPGTSRPPQTPQTPAQEGQGQGLSAAASAYNAAPKALPHCAMPGTADFPPRTRPPTALRVRRPSTRCSHAMPRSTSGASSTAAAARGNLVTWLPAQTTAITPARAQWCGNGRAVRRETLTTRASRPLRACGSTSGKRRLPGPHLPITPVYLAHTCECLGCRLHALPAGHARHVHPCEEKGCCVVQSVEEACI
mgnify:CR=1 FL=1